MATTAKRFAQALIATAVTTHYIVPAATTAILKDLAITNTSANSAAPRVHIVGSGLAASSANQLIATLTIAGNFHFHDLYFQVMNVGDTLQSVANSAVCTIHASGVEIT